MGDELGHYKDPLCLTKMAGEAYRTLDTQRCPG